MWQRRWYNGKHSCLPSSWSGFDSWPTQFYLQPLSYWLHRPTQNCKAVKINYNKYLLIECNAFYVRRKTDLKKLYRKQYETCCWQLIFATNLSVTNLSQNVFLSYTPGNLVTCSMCILLKKYNFIISIKLQYDFCYTKYELFQNIFFSF